MPERVIEKRHTAYHGQNYMHYLHLTDNYQLKYLSFRSLMDGKEAMILKGLTPSLSILSTSFLAFLTTALTRSMLAAAR